MSDILIVNDGAVTGHAPEVARDFNLRLARDARTAKPHQESWSAVSSKSVSQRVDSQINFSWSTDLSVVSDGQIANEPSDIDLSRSTYIAPSNNSATDESALQARACA